MAGNGTLAQLKVKLVGETKDFQKEMTESAKKVKAVGDDLRESGKKMTMGVTLPLVAAGTAALSLASDLEESRNKASVVFGEMSSSVLDFASTSATSLGMAEEQALGMTSTYGSLLKNVGMLPQETAEWSKKLTQLTADYASFHNLKPDEAFEKIKAGLVGSSEPLLSLGKDLRVASVEAYAMKSGLMSAGDEMDNLTMTQARLGTMFEQSTDEWGDFGRTSDGVANSTRIVTAEVLDLAASFGQDLIPLAQDALAVIKPMLETFNNMPESTRKFIITMAGAGAAAGPVLNVTGGLLSNVTKMNSAFKASAAAGGNWTKNVTAMLDPATVYATALVSVAAAGYKVYQTHLLIQDGLDSVSEAMQDSFSEASSGQEVYSTWASGLKNINREYDETNSIGKLFVNMKKIEKQSLRDLSDGLIQAGVSHEEYSQYMADAYVQSGLLTDAEERLIQSSEYQAFTLEWVGEQYGFVNEEMYQYYLLAQEMPTVQEEGTMWLNRFGKAAENTAQSAAVLAAEEEEAKRQAEELAEAQKAAQDAANATALSYLNMSASLKDATNTEIARTEIGLLQEKMAADPENRQAYMTAITDIGLAFGIMDDESVALASNLPIMNELFLAGIIPAEDMAEATGLLMDEAADGEVDWGNLLDELGATPETEADVTEALGNILSETSELISSSDGLLRSWKSLKEWAEANVITIRIHEHRTASSYEPDSGSGEDWDGGWSLDNYANGGPVLAGVPAIVNEMGRGEMFVPNQNGYVLSRGEAMRAGDPVSNAEVVRAIEALGQSLPVRIADQLAVG